MPTNHGAAGPSAGTLWQNQRLLCVLLDETDAHSHVGLEINNDIVVLTSSGICCTSIQNKHSLNDGTITVKSRAWWGSAPVWLDLLDDPSTSDSTEFVLSSTNAVEAGGVFEPFTRSSTTTAEREALLVALLKACETPSAENAPACEKWTNATDDQRRRVVAALRVEAGQPSINRAREEIVQRLLARSFHERAVNEAAEELVGWVEMKIRERISPSGCFITVAECRQKLGLLRDKFTILSLPRLPPDAIDFEAELSTNAAYLRQLNLIKTERDELVSAISTYAEANKHRKYWLDEGLLGEDRVDHFERQLLLQWNSAKGEHAAESDEIRGGKRVYYQCLRARGRLGPEEADPEMIAGNLHVLSQRRLVGWHPRYRELLGDE